MRRSLVLTDEAARHPFRALLPPHVSARAADDIEPRVPLRQRIAADVRGFVEVYCATLVAVLVFFY
jgi:hypothetical protein